MSKVKRQVQCVKVIQDCHTSIFTIIPVGTKLVLPILLTFKGGGNIQGWVFFNFKFKKLCIISSDPFGWKLLSEVQISDEKYFYLDHPPCPCKAF